MTEHESLRAGRLMVCVVFGFFASVAVAKSMYFFAVSPVLAIISFLLLSSQPIRVLRTCSLVFGALSILLATLVGIDLAFLFCYGVAFSVGFLSLIKLNHSKDMS